MYCTTYLASVVLGTIGSLLVNSLATAQNTSRPSRVAESTDVTLTTKDGVKLGATYFPSDMGQEAVPIVLLHDYKESRAVFHALARELQDPADEELESHAVLTVDLRGHGDSTSIVGPRGQTREIDVDQLRATDYQAMVLRDLEAVRSFLVDKNDAGELNLNKLCLIGSGMGANVAASYAAYDWSIPQLPRIKQGQDVKAVVLSSPKWSYPGLPALKALKQEGVRDKVSVLLVYGEHDPKATKDALSIFRNLEKHRPEPPPEQRLEKQNLFQFPLPTRLQGTRLLTDPDFAVLPKLDVFINARLSQQDFDWIRRRQAD